MKKYLVLLVSLLTFQSTFLQNTDVFHKVKINYSKASDLVKLANNGVCIDHGINKKNHFFISDFSLSEIEKIKLLEKKKLKVFIIVLMIPMKELIKKLRKY